MTQAQCTVQGASLTCSVLNLVLRSMLQNSHSFCCCAGQVGDAAVALGQDGSCAAAAAIQALFNTSNTRAAQGKQQHPTAHDWGHTRNTQHTPLEPRSCITLMHPALHLFCLVDCH